MASFFYQTNIFLNDISEGIKIVNAYCELFSDEKANEEKIIAILKKHLGQEFVDILTKKVSSREDIEQSFEFLPKNADNDLIEMAWNQVTLPVPKNPERVWLRTEGGKLNIDIFSGGGFKFIIDPKEKEKNHIKLILDSGDEEMAAVFKHAIIAHAFHAAGYTVGKNVFSSDLEDDEFIE